MAVLGRYGSRILETTYDEEVHIRVETRLSNEETVKQQLVEQTAGRVRVED